METTLAYKFTRKSKNYFDWLLNTIKSEHYYLAEKDINADLFALTANKHQGRSDGSHITFFKSVGHALEDLTAATYYYKLFNK